MMVFTRSKIKRPLSRLVFGGGAISGEGKGYGLSPATEKEAETVLKKSYELGINTFDTAPIYGFGLSEERMGKYLPADAFIISKSGVDWHENGRVNMTNDPKITEKMLHASLKRLKRDKIDLYMVHWPDPRVDIRETLDVLIRAKNEGKIVHIGLCNTNSEDLKKALSVSEIDFLQSEFNLFNNESFDFLENKNDFIKMGWGTFDKGILTSRVHKDRKFDQLDARSWAPWWNKKLIEVKIKKVQKLKEMLNEENLLNVSLKYSLHSVDQVIVGMKSVNDLMNVYENLNQIELTDDQFNIIESWKKQTIAE